MKNICILKSLRLNNCAVIILFLLTITSLQAQTTFTPGGPWDYGYYSSGTAGTVVHNNGVVQLLSSTAGASAASVHETTTKINTGTSWNICYNVFFGCPGSDNIGGPDTKGDGLAWSLYNPLFSSCDPTGGYRLGSVGGGIGYANTGCSKIITIEFDTYSSQNTNDYDLNYGGTVSPSTGNQDEISLHINGWADNTGILFSSNPGNLEDGYEHIICISYTPGSPLGSGGTMQVTIDGTLRFSYNMGATYNLETYLDPYPPCGCTGVPPYTSNSVFDVSALNQMWSSGKDGADNSSIVAPAGVDISSNLIGGAGTLGCFPLPVTFTSTEAARLHNGNVRVTWNVADEISMKEYEVERSEDGMHFTTFQIVAASGSNTYSAMDPEAPTGEIYYRIKGVSLNGERDYTSLEYVAAIDGISYIEVYPNPVNAGGSINLKIKNQAQSNYQVRLYNYLGQSVFQTSVSVASSQHLQSPDLPEQLSSGCYQIEIIGEYGNHTMKTIVLE